MQSDTINSTALLLLELYGEDVVFKSRADIDRFLDQVDLHD